MNNTNKNFQNEIARKIIIQVGMLTMLLCAGLLTVFALEMYWASKATLTTDYVVRMLLEILGATCLICLLVFVVLYFVSRSVARKSLQPLHEALERERSFTSYASHEFRTPLAVLKGSMEVLIRKPRTEEEYKAKITECIEEVDSMNKMVEDLLTLTRVESGKTERKDVSVAVADITNEAVSHHAGQLMQKNINVDIDIQPESETVHTDMRAMTMIMNNIVSNAVKYCNEGGSISIRSRRQEETVKITVTNTGNGIPKNELPQIFNKFYRGRDVTRNNTKGFGLGLSIVNQFADLIGATVTIDSDSGKPTTVTIKINDSRKS